MFHDADSSLNCVSSSGASFDWRKHDGKEQGNENTVDKSRVENTTILPPSAFRVYDKVSEKNRYVPRQWTQEEFEAALPERFKPERSNTSNTRRNFGLAANDGEEIDLRKAKEQEPPSSENTLFTPGLAASRYPRRKPEINEKISNLKAIFEGVENEGDCCQLSDTNNDLERCKESQAKVRLANEESPKEDTDVNDGIVECEINESESRQSSHNSFTSFLDACLQCLLNIEPFVQVLTNSNSTCQTRSSFDVELDIGKLNDLMNTIPSFDNSSPKSNQRHLYARDVFAKFYNEVSTQSRSYDEALATLLETLVEKTTDQAMKTLRSVFQGKFCHATVCEQCETVVREYESFMFLNPTSPPSISSSESRTLDIHLLSNTDVLWRITSHRISVSPGMVVLDLKEQLAGYPEFSGPLDASSIQIGAVKDSRLEVVFDDMEDIWELRLEPTSRLFAFGVINCHSELTNTRKSDNGSAQAAKSRSSGFADMSYHLYFNCGLCLNDGKEVGLLMHRSCGGMVCRDCLDEISQSNRERCPCPICKRPIDLEKELCTTTINAETERNKTHPDVLCGVVFRADTPCGKGAQLFGYPLLVSLPQETTGYHLYRCIGYLLPKALPMKDKTSFTLHKVDESGLRCASCSFPNCTGCLIRIDESVAVVPDTYFAVHFDDLAEESKKDFGINIPGTPQVSKTQALFDGILQSCVDASSSRESLCPKCFHMSRTTSSITEFPELLVIHLNRQYASKGLPVNMTIADVARFFILERGNECQGEVEQGATYQLTAAVLGEENSCAAPTFKPCVPGFSADKWILYDDFRVNETHPTLLYLTSDSVLFYEPVISDPTPAEPSQIGQARGPQSIVDGDREGKGRNESDCPVCDIYCRDLHNVNRLDTITESPAAKYYQRKPSESKRTNEMQSNDRYISKPYNSQLEPGECFLGNDFELDRRFTESDVYGSQLSLGEIKKESVIPSKAIPATVLDGIDTISPITITDEWQSEPRRVRETKKLVKAVKREDAYGIVCSLKRGADPCLLVNDVSALHLAVGIKSDQRCSMVAFLLKYCSDVNVPTADGTTPVHVAAAWGHQDVLELLLAHGGDPFELTDLEGNSAFDLAAKDCSAFLQSVYNRQRNSTRFLELSSSTCASLPNHLDNLRTKEKRLEDIVRSNVGLPSFVEENTSSARVRRRWIQRLRSFRERSSGILRSLRKMSSIRRRSRIGVMATETSGNPPREV